LTGGGLVVILLMRFAFRPRIPEPFTNDVGMMMAGIPAGQFQMGSPGKPNEEEDRHNDESIHKVRVSVFYLGVHEVTQKQFRTVMGWNPSWFSKNASGKKDTAYLLKPGGGANKIPQGDDTENYPVENVSWEESKDFCEKLTALDTKKPAGWKYRLPTEAEWEYACRGGGRSQVFHFGNSLAAAQANFDGKVPYGKAEKIDPLNRTCSVGNYENNAFGLHDMHGNVREWCADWYDYHYYRNSPTNDPSGPDSGTYRVVRGGAWSLYGRVCRSAYRGRAEPASRDWDRGFRVALVKVQ
jgi:formylglycine-generating enzyme required for sulfatase activity